MSASLLTDRDFEACMADLGPFETRPHLACAVSGGADSLALALLAHGWAARRDGRVTALTVDHGLRPEAAGEARQVGDWLKPLGIAHHVLRWSGPKPQTGLQAAARTARYRLLADWCHRAQVLHLLLGHTMDDQAETLLLRLGAGSGPDGLAAMAAIRETDHVRLLRPLLGLRRATLRAVLAAGRQDWIDDPSNQDERFGRVRVRRAIAASDLKIEELARAATRFGRARVALEAAASHLLAVAVAVHPAGFARLDAAALAAAPDEVSLRALHRVIAAIGGRPHGPRLDRLERLHRELMAGTGRSWTLGGCRVVGTEGRAQVVVCREYRGIDRPVPVRPGLGLLWDRRIAIRFADSPGPAGRYWLAGLGQAGWAEVVHDRPELRQIPVPGPARLSLPAVRDDRGVVAVPHLDFRRSDRPGKGSEPMIAVAEVRFAPANALGGVGFFLPNRPDVLSL
ncbi:MAG TPA: tRNA lysidine(34) synthetase TilS [Rhodospirillales bacterium]